jgi:CRISPR-associated protein Cas2
MSDEHLYIVTYDVSDERRWRRIYRLLQGYGEWLQLSVFQCRLSRMRQAEFVQLAEGILDRSHDHLLIIDIGPVESIKPKVVSIGKSYAPLDRGPVIV